MKIKRFRRDLRRNMPPWQSWVCIAASLATFAMGAIFGCDHRPPARIECDRPCCRVTITPPRDMSKQSTDRLNVSKSRQNSYTKRMRVTAYCTCERCCGKWSDGYAASGVRAVGKLIAADRRYPFGTVMTVPGYGTATVQDRGGAIRGDRLDLLFPSHKAALQWGVKWLDVTIGE